MDAVEITCFSDVLCVWAYVSQARIDAVGDRFGDAVRLRHRFCSVFGNTAEKIGSAWQCEIAAPIGVDIGAIEDCIHRGVAFARLTADYQDADRMRIEGSPSYVLNEGRQRLYGNIGFRVMEANVQELLRAPGIDDASWC